MSGAPEFSRPRRIDTLGGQPIAIGIEADEAERAALARRFGLVALAALEASLTLVRDGEIVTVTGHVTARADQACVATGDPVPAEIDEPLLLRFVPEDALAASGAEEIELGAEDCDVIGYSGASIDLGEAVAETMALALDPFPRSPGAEAALRQAGVVGEEEAGPFGALAGLKAMLERKED